MKQFLASVAVVSALFIGSASAQTDSGLSSNDDLGCKIAMCMSNPNGPTAVKECLPPIREMQKRIAKGKPVPKCSFTSNSSGGGGNGGRGGGQGPAPKVK
jgi:hypothetical protein